MRDAHPSTLVGTTTEPSPSDNALVERARSGDQSAYAELFARHRTVATGVARRLAGPDRADDLVSEAFTNVWRLLQNGRGPQTAFLSYLLTAVRNAHLTSRRQLRRETLTADYAELGQGHAVDDDLQGRIDASNMGKAFQSLPERWRRVLWLSAVERREHAEVARALDITPNAVGALAFRAREGLREAYLAEHLLDSAERTCKDTTKRLPAYVRGTLSPRRREQVDAHLDTCGPCSAALLDLRSINLELGALLLFAFPASSALGLSVLGGTVAPVSAGTTSASSFSLGALAPVAAGIVGAVAASSFLITTDTAPRQADPGTTFSAVAQDLDGPAAGQDATVAATTVHDIPASPLPRTAPLPVDEAPSPAPEPAAAPSADAIPDVVTDRAPAAVARAAKPKPVTPVQPSPKPVTPSEPPVTVEPAVDPRLEPAQVVVDRAGTRATVTLQVADLTAGDTVVLTAEHTLSAVIPAQTDWSCTTSADWINGQLWATHTVTCAWSGPARATSPLVAEFGLIGSGSLSATITSDADSNATNNTVSALLG